MRTAIQVILTIAIIVLGYLLYESIMNPIRFNRVKDKRWDATIERLKDIRTAQLAYKSEHGKFTGGFDTLISFVKNDSFSVVKAIGFVPDTLTEMQALELGIVERDTIKIAVLDSLFKKKYAIDSLRYIPYTKGDTFTMASGRIVTGSKVEVEVFEAKAHNNLMLKGLDPQLIANFSDERMKITGYAGLKMGSLTEATNNTGNWE